MAGINNQKIRKTITQFPLIAWFLNLKLIRKIRQNRLGQQLLCYETISYMFFGIFTTVVSILTFEIANRLIGADVIVSFFGEEQSVGYLIANTISFICSMLFAYTTNKLFVFESKNTSFLFVLKEITLFALARLFSFCIEMSWMFITVTLFSILSESVSKLIAQVIVVIANYIFSKIMVFRKPKNKGEF